MSDEGKAKSPIGFKPIIELTNMAINTSNITFSQMTLQSERYVVVKEEAKRKIAIVTTSTKRVKRLQNMGDPPIDQAIMNPTADIVALRNADGQGGTLMNIFSMQVKANMKSARINEECKFWKWVDSKTIAVVTPTQVLHWSIESQEGKPKTLFRRHVADEKAHWVGAVQIINYHQSKDGQWSILSGLAKSTGGARSIVGVLQVFSKRLNASQPIMPSHTACFATATLNGRAKPSTLICFTSAGPALQILELDAPPGATPFKAKVKLQFKVEGDFPVNILSDDANGILFILTHKGMLIAVEVTCAKVFFHHHTKTAIRSCVHGTEGGIVTVDKAGHVLHFFLEKANVVEFICKTLGDVPFGLRMATRYGLPGADHHFRKRFNALLNTKRHLDAIRLVAESPRGVLRTMQTLQVFKQMPPIEGQPASSYYFNMLLKKPGASLNVVETVELVKSLLLRCETQPEKLEQVLKLVREWLGQKKVSSSRELGDALKRSGEAGLKLALQVYSQAQVHDRVIACFLALSHRETDDTKARMIYQEIIRYSSEHKYSPDYCTLVGQLWGVNKPRAKDFALVLIAHEEDEGSALVGVRELANTFQERGDVKAATNVLLEYLRPRGNREEDASLQTKVLLINLASNPRVADAILDSSDYNFTHFDKLKVAMSCERAELFDRALEFYSEMSDYKRVLGHAPSMRIEQLQHFFGRLAPEDAIECLRQLLTNGVRQNLQIVVEIAKKWSEAFTPKRLIDLFEDFNCYEGIYWYTAHFVGECKDKELVFKCIEAGVKCSDRVTDALKFVTTLCRQHDYFDAKRVKDFLLDANLRRDPRPLIYLCDRFGYVDELTEYMWKNNLFQLIEAYVQRMSPRSTPVVIGTLLHLNAPEERIRKILGSTRPPSDDSKFVANLVAECEKVNRLVILRPWLEAQATAESKDPEVYNGLGKIYVDTGTGKQAKTFLLENNLYQPAVVGKYCESRDPLLALVAYKRANGTCDDQLIEVSTKNGFFRDQAQYLVTREDPDLWGKVLSEENKHRRELIDQVVAIALPTAEKPSQVSITVKAFMAAGLPKELIELLERLILHDTGTGREQFRTNKNLQNLLILTAIKADKKRVMDYINRLDNYEGPNIAKIASHPEHKLYDEAFFIYKKFKMGVEAIQILLQKMQDLDRAADFAESWDKPDVWVILGKAQLDAGLVSKAIASFLKADDPVYYEEVISTALKTELFEPLIDFILMARSKMRSPQLDNELIFAYAKTKRLAELEELINERNHARYPEVGQRLYQSKLYLAAKMIYKHIKDFSQLALCHVHLREFKEAVDAAADSNKDPVWREVCFSCADAEEFKLAQRCAMNIVVKTEGLEALCSHYEIRGYFDQLISVLEAGIKLKRAHQGIFTKLGICYCKYKEEKLMQHIKDNWQKLNYSKLIHACRANQMWLEAVHLYNYHSQFDNAVDTIMLHSAECWSHDLFKTTVHQVSNSEMFYRAIEFYLRERPLQLNDLCVDLLKKLDPQRVVTLVRRAGHIPLIREYLLAVQSANHATINDAINGLFYDEENYKALRKSVDSYGAFDQLELARKLKKHGLLEFRRIAAHLYRKNKKFQDSIELSKKDRLWDDAMVTAETSADRKVAEALLAFFVKEREFECFSACLYTCYELIRPDVVLELAWRHKLTDFVMPYMVQSFTDISARMSQLSIKVQSLESRLAEEEKKAEEQDNPATNPIFNSMPRAIMPPPGVNGLGIGSMPVRPPAPPGLVSPLAGAAPVSFPPGQQGGF